MRRIAFVPFIGLIFILSACSLVPGTAPTATSTATDSPTATEFPPTPTDTPSPAPTGTPTPTPFAPFEAAIARTDAANLRTNPGFMFPVLRVLSPGSKMMVLGRAPGGEWFSVQVNDYLKGWVFGNLLDKNSEMENAPVIDPADVIIIRGRVTDSSGTPIRGIGFNVVYRANPGSPSNAAVTDGNGEFFSFMPNYVRGVWTVTFASVDCDSNVWKDPECKVYQAGYSGIMQPLALNVQLPQTGILEFTWK